MNASSASYSYHQLSTHFATVGSNHSPVINVTLPVAKLLNRLWQPALLLIAMTDSAVVVFVRLLNSFCHRTM